MAGSDRQIEHLLRRAGFGARPDELAMYGAMSTTQAVNALVGYDAIPDAVDGLIGKPGYIGMTISGGAFSPQSNINHARQRWLFRMVHSDRPLQEKMTLFWHNHFATGYTKIAGALGATEAARYMAAKASEDPAQVRGQIEMLRETRSASSRTSCSRSRKTRRCSSGSTAGPTPKRSRRRISAARSWSCSPSASGTTPNRT